VYSNIGWYAPRAAIPFAVEGDGYVLELEKTFPTSSWCIYKVTDGNTCNSFMNAPSTVCIIFQLLLGCNIFLQGKQSMGDQFTDVTLCLWKGYPHFMFSNSQAMILMKPKPHESGSLALELLHPPAIVHWQNRTLFCGLCFSMDDDPLCIQTIVFYAASQFPFTQTLTCSITTNRYTFV